MWVYVDCNHFYFVVQCKKKEKKTRNVCLLIHSEQYPFVDVELWWWKTQYASKKKLSTQKMVSVCVAGNFTFFFWKKKIISLFSSLLVNLMQFGIHHRNCSEQFVLHLFLCTLILTRFNFLTFPNHHKFSPILILQFECDSNHNLQQYSYLD